MSSFFSTRKKHNGEALRRSPQPEGREEKQKINAGPRFRGRFSSHLPGTWLGTFVCATLKEASSLLALCRGTMSRELPFCAASPHGGRDFKRFPAGAFHFAVGSNTGMPRHGLLAILLVNGLLVDGSCQTIGPVAFRFT